MSFAGAVGRVCFTSTRIWGVTLLGLFLLNDPARGWCEVSSMDVIAWESRCFFLYLIVSEIRKGECDAEMHLIFLAENKSSSGKGRKSHAFSF